MKPPPLAAIAHGKCHSTRVSNSVSDAWTSNPRDVTPPHQPRRCASGALAVGWCVSLLFKASVTRMPRLRNFDTRPPSSYCYEFRSDNRLESVANVHTAADLHVRPVS